LHFQKTRAYKTRSRNKEIEKRSHQYKKNEKLRTATVFKNTHAAKQYNRTHVEVEKDQKQLKDSAFFVFLVEGDKKRERNKKSRKR